MHIHHYTLEKIAAHIRATLPNAIFGEAVTQEKDQIVIGLANKDRELYLRVACGPPLPYIWPVERFHKARKNVRVLFEELEGLAVLDVQTVPYERVILISLQDDYQVVLKMHGLSSNVLVMQNGKVVNRFRHHADADMDYQPEPGAFDEDWKEKANIAAENSDDPSDEAPTKKTTSQRLKDISMIYNKQFVKRVDALMAEGKGFVPAMEASIAEAQDDRYWVRKQSRKMEFLLFNPNDPEALDFDSLGQALSIFFRSWYQYNTYARHYETLTKPLAKHIKRYTGQIDSFYNSIEKISTERPPEEIGHILMANLHAFGQGLKKIELFDFYNDQQIEIKLKPELNPQQNAENYYNKQKKHRSRVKHLEVQIERLESELSQYLTVQAGFEEFPVPTSLELGPKGIDGTLVKGITAFVKDHGNLLKARKPDLAGRKHPFHEFVKDGYTILIGKNSKQNDALTFGLCRKNDTWMHVRDAPGSHLVVRNPTGKTLPVPVLEYAASLAAHFSKRKSEGLVPVQYTERKYVRKVRGGAPGQVILERESVVMVAPANL